MSLQVIFLGTAGSIPTNKRSLPAIAIKKKGELIFFDCGEGVQRQIVKAGLGFNKKMKVFVTHMHGDHMLGLPGLIQTMALLDRTKKLEIYGPAGLEDFIEAIEKTVQFTLTFPLEIAEIENEGLVCEEKEYEVYAAWMDHSAPSLAYSLVEKPRPGKFYPEKAKALGIPEGELWSKLQHGTTIKLPRGRVVKPEEVIGSLRKGRKIVYTGDGKFSESLVAFAEGADLLIHDCTFDDELAERAEEDGHSTPSQAVKTAKKAKVKRLILTHISARYKSPELLVEQARKSGFSNVDVAEDFMQIDLPLPRG
jgi:ribonuclease Z